MTSRFHTLLILAITLLIGFTADVSAEPQGKVRIFGGGSNNNDNSDNDDNNQDGNRRNRNRSDDDEQNQGGGFRIGGSDAQKIQKAIQDFQGNSDPSQQRRRNGQGFEFNNNQREQNFQQNHQGDWPNQNRRHRHNRQSWAVEFGGSAPFSVKWYEDHPQAFHHHHHHDDDAWKVATATGVIGWLGWGAHHHHPQDTAIVYHPAPIESYVIDPNAPGEWMMLGVYSLMTGPGDEGTRLVELAVDKHGHIRGNYYDTIANASHNLTGHIHEPTQQVQWTLDTNRQLVFFTPLSQLTQSQGVVYVKLPSGKQQQWQLARMENASN